MHADKGILFLLLLYALFLIVYALFLTSLQKALVRAGERNRKMSPGLVWLNLIPIFSWGWFFYTVHSVSGAIVNKHKELGIPDRGNGGWILGFLSAILGIASGCVTLIGALGVRGLGIVQNVFGILTILVWMVYWVRIARYNGAMSSKQSGVA